jgi:hypothetical protein
VFETDRASLAEHHYSMHGLGLMTNDELIIEPVDADIE